MRIPLLLASAAALSLAACGKTGGDSAKAGEQSSAQSDVQVSDHDLEDQVMAALADAPEHGLTKDLFLKGDLPGDKSERRKALLGAARDFASALADGKADPTKIRDVYTVPRPKVDVEAGLRQSLSQGKFEQWVNSLAPQTDEYKALSSAFVALVQRSPDLPDQDIPTGGTVHRGGSDKRVPLIVRNLQALGYLPPNSDQQQFSGTKFTPAMSQALSRFQADSGLKSDGVIGPDTVKALNQGPRDRARTLAIAMERLRWLERNPPATRIDVNTAASTLDYFRDGQHIDHRKVINGQPGWETPQIGAPIFQLVANPTWTVPKSIVEEEIADKSSGWLASNNFTQKNGHWVQGSGPDNALGVVKLDMKDDQAIYLHDTPAKSLFSLDDRHRSHGCVRVEKALEFAHMLARADGIDDKFSEAMASGKETFVDLNHDIPVRLMYHTAYLGDDGRIHYAADVYGWDNDVAEALGYAKVERKQVSRRGEDIGP